MHMAVFAGRIGLNFHTDLTQLIRETRYLDRMGFTIPDIALNVTLQENKYHQCLEGLNRMIDNYYQVSSLAQLYVARFVAPIT